MLFPVPKLEHNGYIEWGRLAAVKPIMFGRELGCACVRASFLYMN